MKLCLFCTDIHGRCERYTTLFREIERRRPEAVFLGGDLLPGLLVGASAGDDPPDDFVRDFLAAQLENLRQRLGSQYPRIFTILGNDDFKALQPDFEEVEASGLWTLAHGRRLRFEDCDVYGYSYVPPTPFRLKDWERYDVSRYVDPGCVSPEEGGRSVPIDLLRARFATILDDLERLTTGTDLSRAVMLFHTPPYQTLLDRAALDGKMVDHVPLDVHVGSIAVRRFIEARQPLLTLHGHVHESARLTGSWRDSLGDTQMFSAAHDGPELALVWFDLEHPENADRTLL